MISPTIDAVLLYNIQVVDGVYSISTRHMYESWAKCLGTHRLSKGEAMFTIMENAESGGGSYYLKVI